MSRYAWEFFAGKTQKVVFYLPSGRIFWKLFVIITVNGKQPTHPSLNMIIVMAGVRLLARLSQCRVEMPYGTVLGMLSLLTELHRKLEKNS